MTGRNYDVRAVASGAALEAVAVPVLLVASGSLAVVLVCGPAVGGVVAGARSRTLGDEYVDGAFGAVGGLLLGSLAAPLLAVAVGLSPDALVASVVGVLGLLVGGVPVGLLVGAVSGYAAVRVRRRRRIAAD